MGPRPSGSRQRPRPRPELPRPRRDRDVCQTARDETETRPSSVRDETEIFFWLRLGRLIYAWYTLPTVFRKKESLVGINTEKDRKGPKRTVKGPTKAEKDVLINYSPKRRRKVAVGIIVTEKQQAVAPIRGWGRLPRPPPDSQNNKCFWFY